jgi:hypothetical protein
MDEQLEKRLRLWLEQIEVLKGVELECFHLEASEKSFFAELFLQQEGKTASEREHRAFACEDWKGFKRGLAEAKSRMNHERRILELRQKAYEATYLTYKLESDAINKGFK